MKLEEIISLNDDKIMFLEDLCDAYCKNEIEYDDLFEINKDILNGCDFMPLVCEENNYEIRKVCKRVLHHTETKTGEDIFVNVWEARHYNENGAIDELYTAYEMA